MTYNSLGDVMDEILSKLTDKQLLHKAIAINQNWLSVEDVQLFTSDKYQKKYLSTIFKIIEYYDGDVGYFDLLGKKELMHSLLETAREHMDEGIRLDMLLGSAKVYCIYYEYILSHSSINKKDVIRFLVNLRKIHDAFEVIAVKEWFIHINEVNCIKINMLQEKVETRNLQLSALIETSSDFIAIVDMEGKIIFMNHKMASYFSIINCEERQLCSLLNYEHISFNELLKFYNYGGRKQLCLSNGEQFYTTLSKLPAGLFLFSMSYIRKSPSSSIKEMISKFTPSENAVCSCIIKGMTTREIADNLFISIDTVNTHRRNIRRKLELIGKNETITQKLGSFK